MRVTLDAVLAVAGLRHIVSRKWRRSELARSHPTRVRRVVALGGTLVSTGAQGWGALSAETGERLKPVRVNGPATWSRSAFETQPFGGTMSLDRHARTMLPIPDRPSPGLTTYDAKDPDTAFPPIEPLLPPEGAPNVLIIL